MKKTLLFLGIFFPYLVVGQIHWQWSDASTGLESGTFVTNGTLNQDGSAPAGTYTISDFKLVKTSTIVPTTGSYATGEWFGGTQAPIGFVWDGSSPTQFWRSGGSLTNGLNIYTSDWSYGISMSIDYFVIKEGAYNALVSSNVTINLNPYNPEVSNAGILLNGIVSAENNQIKNVADPTDNQDAATKGYVDNNVNSFSGSYNDLTDKPTSFSGDLSGNVTSNFLKLNPLTQAEIDNLNPEAGTIVFNADSEKFIGYSGSAGHQLDQSQENQNQLFDNSNTAQSFTAGSSGSLSKIDVKLSNGMYGQPDNNVTLTLRDGEGTDGDVLFSTGLSTSSSTAEWISVDISGVEITQGSKYTIHLTSTTFIDEVFMWARDNANPYPNGKSFYSNTAYIDYDLCFKTYISTSGWVDLN